MDTIAPLTILAAKLLGDRSYILVFTAGGETYELHLLGAGYPGEFTGFMTPSLHNQLTGRECYGFGWPQAGELAGRLQNAIASTEDSAIITRQVVEALQSGRRYGHEA
jgi:hypothetical protein